MSKTPAFFENASVRKAFLDCVKLGMPIADALAYAGVSSSSYHDALEKGKTAIQNGKPDKFSKFAEDFKKAQGEFARNNLEIIHQATKKDWHAAAWLLERRKPKDFAQKQEVSAEGVTLTIVNDVPKR